MKLKEDQSYYVEFKGTDYMIVVGLCESFTWYKKLFNDWVRITPNEKETEAWMKLYAHMDSEMVSCNCNEICYVC